MSNHRAFVTVGLLFGDEGKGTIVDSLVRHYNIPLVVRYNGGAQCAHNVITPDGKHHVFAQFGAGSFAGARTLLMDHVLVDPVRLMNESEVLEKKVDFFPMDRMFVHEEALVITPFHRALNQIKETARGAKRHGSCGIGIGQTRKFGDAYPDLALRIKDLKSSEKTKEKLLIMRGILKMWADKVDKSAISPDQLQKLYEPFTSSKAIDSYLYSYKLFSARVKIIDHKEALFMITSQDTVWEGAQGVLLDEDFGFRPHTTWSKTTTEHAMEALFQANVSRIQTIGIMRSYAHRHGMGPLPTENEILKQNLSEPHNVHNEWQGGFRVGYLDLNLISHAIYCNGGIDTLAITHMDKVGEVNKIYYDPIRSLLDLNSESVEVNKEEFITKVSSILGVSASILSFGPTADHKVYIKTS